MRGERAEKDERINETLQAEKGKKKRLERPDVT